MTIRNTPNKRIVTQMRQRLRTTMMKNQKRSWRALSQSNRERALNWRSLSVQATLQTLNLEERRVFSSRIQTSQMFSRHWTLKTRTTAQCWIKWLWTRNSRHLTTQSPTLKSSKPTIAVCQRWWKKRDREAPQEGHMQNSNLKKMNLLVSSLDSQNWQMRNEYTSLTRITTVISWRHITTSSSLHSPTQVRSQWPQGWATNQLTLSWEPLSS